MKNVFVVVFFLAISVAVAEEKEKKLERHPRLFCDETNYDFGAVHSGKLIEHGFILKNNGEAPLHIHVAGCCGMKTDTGSNVIGVGETTSLIVSFSLKGLEGKQVRLVVIKSDDPEQTNFAIHLKGEAISPAKMQPNIISFGQISKNDAA